MEKAVKPQKLDVVERLSASTGYYGCSDKDKAI